MKAAVFHSPKKITADTVPDPAIQHHEDIILKVTSTAICGSDLHIYNGFIPQTKPIAMGHEFMGIVEEVGKGVTKLKRGDRVVVPFPIACGQCWFCCTQGRQDSDTWCIRYALRQLPNRATVRQRDNDCRRSSSRT